MVLPPGARPPPAAGATSVWVETVGSGSVIEVAEEMAGVLVGVDGAEHFLGGGVARSADRALLSGEGVEVAEGTGVRIVGDAPEDR